MHDQIIGGSLHPGDRLPTRRDLQRKFQTSLSTIQQALDQLATDGFIIPRGKAGTFVAHEPPHRSRYGFVIPSESHRPGFPRFWTALSNEILKVSQRPGRSVRIYQGVADMDASPDYRALMADIDRHRLAGMIFASNPFFLHDDALFERSGIPCVAIGSKPALARGITTVSLDGTSFARKAIGWLAHRGRRRIAIVLRAGAASSESEFHQPFLDALAENGLKLRPYLLQEADGPSARNLAHLLMRLAPSERPDGLVIADDNLVEHASAGIVDSGVRADGALDVVVHCNFPWPSPSVIEVRRLGFDSREVISASLRCIDEQNSGKRVASPPPIPARFEDELLPAGESPDARMTSN